MPKPSPLVRSRLQSTTSSRPPLDYRHRLPLDQCYLSLSLSVLYKLSAYGCVLLCYLYIERERKFRVYLGFGFSWESPNAIVVISVYGFGFSCTKTNVSLQSSLSVSKCLFLFIFSFFRRRSWKIYNLIQTPELSNSYLSLKLIR